MIPMIFNPQPKPSKVVKKKHKVKSDRKELVAACDDLVREILYRIEDRCFVTGDQLGRFRPIHNEDGLTVGHFIQRSVLELRWDLTNCHLQSAWSNSLHETDKGPYTQAMIKKYGFREVQRLQKIEINQKLSTKTMPHTKLIDIHNQLENILFQLTQGKSITRNQ